MMNSSGIRDEEAIGSREPWFQDRRPQGDPGPGARRNRSRWFDGSGVEMAGMAEGYWKELRPSSAARLRLGATIHDGHKSTARDLRLRLRRRQPARPKVRRATTSRG
jgi:hypothetical protein